MIAKTLTAEPVAARWSPALWGLLFVLSGNMLLDALEVSVSVVALPSIGDDLGPGPSLLVWTMGGFALGFGALLLHANRITAARGRRRVYLAALAVFAVASLVAGLADNVPLLLATRVVKGGCAALTAPTGLAIIAGTFREGPARGRAVSVYSLFGASGFSVGLVLSGLLTQQSWRWTLAFPAPVALLLLAFGLWLIPRDEPRQALGGVRPGLRLLAHRPLLRSALGAAALNGSYWGFLFLATLQLQRTTGWSPLRTGLALLPGALLLTVAAPFAGRLVARVGPARLIALGAAAPPLGYALYLRAGTPHSYPADVLPTVLLVGVGFVLGFSALHMQALGGVERERQAAVGSVYQASVQLGGVAVLVPVAALGHRGALVLVTAVGLAGLAVGLSGVVAGRDAAPPCDGARPPDAGARADTP